MSRGGAKPNQDGSRPSIGGEAGSELAQVITSTSALTAAYQQVITAYGLTHIDFDIEGAAVADHASIDRRSQAIAALQATAAAAGKTLDVSFTLPVLPSGLTADGLYVLQSALKYGVKISTVNAMAMDYGDRVAPNPSGQMGAYAIDAAQSTFTQLGTLYGSTLSTSQLWGMVGVTPMIGMNDQSDEVFSCQLSVVKNVRDSRRNCTFFPGFNLRYAAPRAIDCDRTKALFLDDVGAVRYDAI